MSPKIKTIEKVFLFLFFKLFFLLFDYSKCPRHAQNYEKFESNVKVAVFISR